MRKITAPVGTFDESTRLGLYVKQVLTHPEGAGRGDAGNVGESRKGEMRMKTSILLSLLLLLPSAGLLDAGRG